MADLLVLHNQKMASLHLSGHEWVGCIAVALQHFQWHCYEPHAARTQGCRHCPCAHLTAWH